MSGTTIPIEHWGRDHWTTFAYMANRIINYSGVLDKERMRCNPNSHPYFAHRGTTPPFPLTRLMGMEPPPDHDDWSCLEDAEAIGLIEDLGTGLNPRFAFTELGWAVWHAFDRHIAANPTKWSSTFDGWKSILAEQEATVGPTG
jgi:hypothetical protein